MGFYSQRWMRAKYPKFPSVGRFEYATFDPEKWTTEYELAPFANRLPDDTYWAAKQVMAFTDEEIRALVARDSIATRMRKHGSLECLIARRDRLDEPTSRRCFLSITSELRTVSWRSTTSKRNTALCHLLEATMSSGLISTTRSKNILLLEGR